MKRRYDAPNELIWVLVMIGITIIAGDLFGKYWVYSNPMPEKCNTCGLNHYGDCPHQESN